MSLALLVHLTAAMVVGPAAALAYLAVSTRRGARRPRRLMPEGRRPPTARVEDAQAVSRLAASRRLADPGRRAGGATPSGGCRASGWRPPREPSDFAFAHPSEGVLRRLVADRQPSRAELQVDVCWRCGSAGLVWSWCGSGRIRGSASSGFCGAGFFWGYLAGGFPALDFLQPGRHTYACYTALALAGGSGLDALLLRLAGRRRGRGRLDRWVDGRRALMIGLSGCWVRHSVESFAGAALGPASRFCRAGPRRGCSGSSTGSSTHVQPGERLLYEEGGKGLPGIPDPFQRGRFSGLLARADRRRGDRRPVSACVADDQFHPVWRREAVRQDRLGSRPLRERMPGFTGRRRSSAGARMRGGFAGPTPT